MTESSEVVAPVVVSDVVRFRSDLFFEGAVQLRWVDDDPVRASKAARHFVFHGPRYHAIRREDESDGYVLRDTASFSVELVEAIANGERQQGNPFSLAIAGYGAGKSHLAVTLAELLAAPRGEVAQQIVQNAMVADASVGARLTKALQTLGRPVLTVTLDGMANFNLGAELARSIIVKLRGTGCDLAAIEELSPRFTYAEQFVARNFVLRGSDFAELIPGCDAEAIIAQLREHDEAVYSAVDMVFERANGAHIPIEGRESIQDLIATVTSVYCSSDGPFSGLLILFDEFGRFLEFAAEQPHLAGDSALQQLFQGVQDSAGYARFLGFIQYDLKAYVSRLDRRDLMHLQRYITRFEAAEKSYLSTNLETLFAHLIEKRAPVFIDNRIKVGDDIAVMHYLLRQALPEASRLPVWNELEQFRQVICAGCWPLDPLAVWFLTRQQDVVQSRSALNIVKAAIERVSAMPVLTPGGKALTISAADLLLTGMLPEFVAAEQTRGGTVAEILQAILEERAAHLQDDDRHLLAAAAVLLKLRVRLSQQADYQRVLAMAAGLSEEELGGALRRLVEELGVLEWNEDFGQYELVQDAATRGQFTRLLRLRCQEPAAQAVGPLFINYARTLCNLALVDPGFADDRRIKTQDWRYEPSFATTPTITEIIANAFRDWRQATDVNDAKGRIIYLYVGADEAVEQVRVVVRQALGAALQEQGVARAPVWVTLLHDADARLAESLQRNWVLERGLNEQERERYRRFVSAETEHVASLAQDATARALGERLHEIAGFETAPTGRLSQVGREVFSQVYPQVLPFPFDGFATGTGAGPAAKKDCLDIVRALISGELDDEWIQSRSVRLRNRASQILVSAWEMLDRDGDLAAESGNERVAAVLAAMDEWHLAYPQRTLEITQRTLIAPPYGCNSASVALLFGLFLARRRPRRRLLMDGEACQASAWISEGLRASDLDIRVLARTTVGFIADDDQARWKHLLEDWRNASGHRQRIEYWRQAKLLEEDSVVPEEYHYQYDRLVEEAKAAREAIISFTRRFEKIQRDLETLPQRAHSLSSLAVCDRLIALHEEVTNGAWEPQDIAGVEGLIGPLRQWVEQEGARWIERAHCGSPQEVADYRSRMEKAVATFKKLELQALAAAAEQQKTHSIATVEERFQFQSVIAEARQFVAVTTVSSVQSIAELEALQIKVDRFHEALEQAKRAFRASELNDLIDELQRVRQLAASAISAHRAELQSLYQTSIDSLDSARNLLARIVQAQRIFAGQRDLADIEDARRQLEKVCVDLETWSSMEGSPEEVEAQLASAIKTRVTELEQWCDEEEVEPLWGFGDVYERFCRRHVEGLLEQSALWVRSFLPKPHAIESMSLDRCWQSIKVLDGKQPVYLSSSDREIVKHTLDAMQARVRELKEQKAREEALRWLEQFSGVKERVEDLSGSECDHLLRVLRCQPDYLSTVELEQVKQLTIAVEHRLDQLDVSDILARVRRLRPELRRQLAEVIASLDAENV